MSSWCRKMTNNGWRVFPLDILEPFMKSIGAKSFEVEPTESVHIDMPGMIMVDRSYQKFTFEGLEVEIPTQDFSIMYDQLSRAKVEVFPGGVEVVKLRGWLSGLVLPVALRRPFLELMGEMLPAAKIQGQKEDEEFSRRISEINKGSVKVVSARAEAVKQRGPGKEKPN